MNQIAPNEEFLKKYLLGDIDEVARERLEERLLTDEEFFQDFATLEDRLEDVLIDEYVGGEMSEHTRAGFENVFLAAPHRVEKLRLVQGLHDYVNSPAVTAAETPAAVGGRRAGDATPQWWRPVPAVLGRAAPYATLILVLALISAVIGVVAFYSKSRRLEAELGALRQQQPSEQGISDELAQLRVHNAELADALRRVEAERSASAEATPTPTARPTHETVARTPKPEPSRVFTLALSLVRSRAEDGQSVSELKLPTGVTILRLLLKLDTVDPNDYKSFSAAVSKRDGTPVKSSGVLKSSSGGGEPHVTMTLPAERLASGDYVVRLSGRQVGGTASLIGVYDFRVVR